MQNTNYFEWIAPTGMPSTSSLTNPTFTFSTPGIHYITIKVGNEIESILKTIAVEVLDAPTANFEYEIEDNTATFINTTKNTLETTWTLGDGTPDIFNQDTVTHEYAANDFTVTLSVSGLYGTDSTQQDISIPPDFSFQLYPVPTANFVTLKILPVVKRDFEFFVFDALGKQVFSKKWEGVTAETFREDLSFRPSACYFYKLILKEKTITGKLMVIH